MGRESQVPRPSWPAVAEKSAERQWGLTMKLFFQLCVAYAVVALVAVAIVRDIALADLAEAGLATIAFGAVMIAAAKSTLPWLVMVPIFVGPRRFIANLDEVGYAVAGSIIFQVAFSLVKSSIPFFVPFYADPRLAALDRWLHGGTDAWVFTHDWAGRVHVEQLFSLYLVIWSFVAIGFMVGVALTDEDVGRKRRFTALFFLCWVGLGTVLAVACASVGPVFYDALLGGDRFELLGSALAASPIRGSRLAEVQAYLWEAYSSGGVAFGSGISAFPSVHVAVATILALYLYERRAWLVIPGLLFVAAILFLAVYSGYHYAVDGYVSIAVIVAGWALLRSAERAAQERNAVAAE